MIHQEPSGILLPNMGLLTPTLPRVRLGDVALEHKPRKAVDEIKFTITTVIDANEGENLQFLLEEMLANGVSRIAIDPAHRLYPGIQALDPTSKKRWLIEINQDHAAMPELQTLMRPLSEEFDVELFPGGIKMDSDVSRALPNEVKDSLITLYSSIYRFVLGMKYKVQIDIPLDATKKALEHVRRISGHKRTRENLAVIHAILSTYRPIPINGLQFRSTANEQQVIMLRELIEDHLLEDENYVRLSHSRFRLGIGRHVQRALVNIRRLSERLLRHPRFSQIYEPSTDLIQVSTKAMAGVRLPLPSTKALTALCRQEYLPPIAHFKVGPPSWESWFQMKVEQQALERKLPPDIVQKLSTLFTNKTSTPRDG